MKWYQFDSDMPRNLDIRKMEARGGDRWCWAYTRLLCLIAENVSPTNLSFSLTTNDGKPIPSDDLRPLLGWPENQEGSNKLKTFLDFCADQKLIHKDSWRKKNLVFCPKMAKRCDNFIKELQRKNTVTTQQDIDIDIDKDKDKDKKSVAAKEPQAASPARLFLTWYGQEFLSRSGAKYMCTFNVETQLVKQMLTDFGEDELRRRTILFLDDTDPWLDKAGRTIKILRSRINSYVMKQPPKFGGMPPPPPDPSCRPGKKFEPVDENSEAYRRYRRLYHGEK